LFTHMFLCHQAV